MPRAKVLIIEDEPDLVQLITYHLEREGYAVISVRSGEDGLRRARQDTPALILLDLMLPGIGGLDVCRLLRSDEETRNTPIIVLTARSEEVDVVAGLEVGADDYVTKPFSPRILMARVRTVLRRRVSGEDAEASVIQAGDLSMDLGKHQVNLAGKPVVLTPTEFALLLILARRPGWVFSRSQLIDSLHDGQYVITDRAIDVQVANLRKKLGEWGGLIETVRGAGYRLRENS